MDSIISWLNANPGMAQILSPVAAAVVTFFGILWMYRKTSAVKALEATIGQLKATNDHLNLLIDGLRDSEAESKAAYEKAKNQCDNLQKITAVEIDGYKAEIAALHDKISALEKLMTERPSLISWGSDMYREAFPENPDDHRTHKFYCSACWNVKRLVVPKETHHGTTSACKNWSEPWHQEYRYDPRL